MHGYIKMDLREIGFNGVRWIQLAQDTAQIEVFYDKDELGLHTNRNFLNILISVEWSGKTSRGLGPG
jgi:hypothetical protein